jgi:putative DNA primase/helicase
MTTYCNPRELLAEVRAERAIQRGDKLIDDDRMLEGSDPFTEDALALRFSEKHKNDLRYIALKGQWLKWDGDRWLPEATLLAFDLARDSCREDAAHYGNGKPPPGISSAKTVAAVERLAKADRRQAATLEQWDADDWVTNMKMATVDLHTGIDRPPDPADYITKKTACRAAPPGTPHPIWSAFLDRVTGGDVELQKFLQRYVGYCLTGVTTEHKFVFAYGTGANGKSTFINTIREILGDYATVADVGTFIASNTERHPTDVAKLHGYRLVVAQETEKGRRWDEAKIKTMTGGDKMTARFMRQDFFDFIPKFKLFVTGNHKPQLNNVDEAMRRRLLLVPFTVQIPIEERDPALPEKLKAEWPAILRWCLEGCLEWQRIGLAPPKIVTDATADYFDDQDLVKQWLDECTEADTPVAFISASQLFASWKGWCDQRGFATGSAKALSEALSDRGLIPKRTKKGRGFASLKLKPADRSGDAW